MITMRYKRLKLSAILLLGYGLAGIHAQISINASGSSASGAGGSISYSLGQVVYTTHTGTNGSVALGVQHPYEISVVTAIEEAKSINLSVTVYPNPTADFLTLEVKEFDLSNLSFQLYDMSGKLLQRENIIGNLINITINNHKPATYILKIFQDNKEIKSFKIIKK